MFWGIWLFLGAGLGWWTHTLFGGAAVAVQERPREAAPDNVTSLIAAAAEFFRRRGAGAPQGGQAEPIVDPPPGNGGQAVAPEPRRNRDLKRLVFFALLAIVLLLASEPHIDGLHPAVYWLEGLLLSPRMLALFSGATLGFGVSRYRHHVAARLHDFYEAFLGSETKSSWALQSVVAIVALLMIVLAIKPDLLDHLESFKAGDVEAKFANISAATREARVTTNDLTKQVTIKQWVDFRKSYLQGSAREYALEFDASDIKDIRRGIRDVLFENYVEPLINLLDCLSEDGRIDRIRRNDKFVRLAIVLRNKILKEAKDGSGGSFTNDDWIYLFGLVDAEVRALHRIVRREVSEDIQKEKCPRIDSINISAAAMEKRSQALAAQLDELVREAVKILKASPDERSYKLSFLDPYFTAAVSDLVALTLGHTEKANFLSQVKQSYPKRLDFIQPGIISLYYYLGDAKLKSDTPWPLDEELEELDFAMSGADHLIGKARERADEVSSPNTRTGRRLPTSYDAIVRVYFRNKFIFLSRYLEIFDQHVLAGEELTEHDRFKWAQFYKLIERVLNLREIGPSLDLEPIPVISERDTPEWIGIEISPEVKFDARVGLSLSAVLLTEQKSKSTPQACTVARFHAHKAKELLPEIDLNEAEKSQLRGYVSQIEARVKASCPDSR